jgi:hypothetical protein
MNPNPSPDLQPLRDLVRDELDQHWLTFAQQHPNLAAAIDRVRLVEAAVQSLRDDPAFRAALLRADLDERRLADAARLLPLLRRSVLRLLPV